MCLGVILLGFFVLFFFHLFSFFLFFKNYTKILNYNFTYVKVVVDYNLRLNTVLLTDILKLKYILEKTSSVSLMDSTH